MMHRLVENDYSESHRRMYCWVAHQFVRLVGMPNEFGYRNNPSLFLLLFGRSILALSSPIYGVNHGTVIYRRADIQTTIRPSDYQSIGLRVP